MRPKLFFSTTLDCKRIPPNWQLQFVSNLIRRMDDRLYLSSWYHYQHHYQVNETSDRWWPSWYPQLKINRTRDFSFSPTTLTVEWKLWHTWHTFLFFIFHQNTWSRFTSNEVRLRLSPSHIKSMLHRTINFKPETWNPSILLYFWTKERRKMLTTSDPKIFMKSSVQRCRTQDVFMYQARCGSSIYIFTYKESK